MQRLEYENGQLKGNTLANWKPMELPENWTDVVAPPCSGHESCGGVSDGLKPLDHAVGCAVHDRITVVQARRNKRLQLDCPPSVAELFRLPPLKSGTLYRNTSSQLQRCSPSGFTRKRFYYNNLSAYSTLVDLVAISVT